MGSNIMTWSSRKQASMSRSSMEAEYRALATTNSKIIWIQNLLSELKVSSSTIPTLYYDNESVVLLAVNPILHSRTKYFELDLHFVRDRVNQQKLHVVHACSFTRTACRYIYKDIIVRFV
ncbi:Copia protein [Arachis hypogaea]|nr:Copia protein [Arachis hypogaea]